MFNAKIELVVFAVIVIRLLGILTVLHDFQRIGSTQILVLEMVAFILQLVRNWAAFSMSLSQCLSELILRWVSAWVLIWSIGLDLSQMNLIISFTVAVHSLAGDVCWILFFCWCSSFVYLLDWNAPWQNWPVPTYAVWCTCNILGDCKELKINSRRAKSV